MAITSNQFASVEAYLAGCPVTGDPVQAECFMLAKIAGSTNATIALRAQGAANQAAQQQGMGNQSTPLILTAYWASL